MKPRMSTKNVKGNRKVVVAHFYSPWATYKIPDGLDLEDKNIVEAWCVKWGTLRILYTDGREEEIDPEFDPEVDNNYPEDYSIEYAEDYSIAYEEDEEDSEVVLEDNEAKD